MGLLQKALETYDAMEKLAGIYEAGKEPLAPIGHAIRIPTIEITIDADGRFVEARPAEKDQKIIIPATKESSERTRDLAPHPLCDQLGYISGIDEKKFRLYIEVLEAWTQSGHSHPKAEAVLKYVKSGTMRADLAAMGVSTKDKNAMVCWRVVGMGADSGPVWTDKALMNAFSDYYISQKGDAKKLCMLSGEFAPPASKHIRGLFSLYRSAKLISANDNENCTYRGRFIEKEDALTVGYIASQKAHNALKWLIANQATIQGGRAFVCWNPQGNSVPNITSPLCFDAEEELPTYKEYREDLHKKIAGYSENWTPSSQVIIAAFDASCNGPKKSNHGRLAVTYYNEMLGSDFMERLKRWDETCCWKDAFKGVRSPLLYGIIAYAFGTPRYSDAEDDASKKQVKKTSRKKRKPKKTDDNNTIIVDDKIIAPQMQRLLSCRLDQAAFPLDIMKAIVARAEQMQNYRPAHRNTLLFTACAVIRKYYIDHQKGAFDLALEPERKDRSYQWGRMIAVLEKAERDTYESDEKHEPNAIRMQSMFVRQPAYAFKIVMEQLKNAYYPRLPVKQRISYDRLIGEITEQLSQDIGNYRKPLTETYLLGYYLQKSALYTKKDNSETEDNDDEV